jgi:threonine/homoserine/homoserine lactone efflux protein
MPTTAALLAFLLASLVVVVIPGPSVVYVMARGISQGRSAALLSVVGLELGALVHLLATTVGLGTLVGAWPELLTVMRWAGAGYLAWLAVRELRASCSSVQPATLRPAGRWRLVRDGLVIDVLNPGTALFFLAFLPQFVDPARGPVGVQIMLLGLCFLLLASANDAVYAVVSGALAAGHGRRWLARRQVQVATACVYLALAAAAVLVHA